MNIYTGVYVHVTPGLLLLPLECARRNTMKDHAPAAGRLVCSQVGGYQHRLLCQCVTQFQTQKRMKGRQYLADNNRHAYGASAHS